MLTIAVANQKGGVAKTTTCLSLGACWAEEGRRVLLVDADAQANLTLGLNYQPESLDHTLYDVLAGTRTAAATIITTSVANLSLLPAGPDIAALQAEIFSRPQYEFMLKRQLVACGQSFDLALIDCPPAIGYLTINALTAADLLLIPVQCEYYAAKGLAQLLQITNLVRQYTNPPLRYRVVVTMYDKRIKAAHIMLDELERTFGADMCRQMIGVDARVQMSQIVGQPITQYARMTRAAEQYRALATEIWDHAARVG